MDAEVGLEVSVQLQVQTSTLHLSDDDFATRTAAAAARIKVSQLRQSEPVTCAATLGAAGDRLSTIAEDEPVNHGRTEDIPTVVSKSAQPSTTSNLLHGGKSPFTHPGELVSIPSNLPTEDGDNASLSDTASDATARPSYESENTAPGAPIDLTQQFAIRQADGSYKDVDMRQVAPWLYQEDEVARMPRPSNQTPPSSFGRVSRACQLVPANDTHTLVDTVEDGLTTNAASTITSKCISPGDPKSSLKSVFSPSPTSGLRKIKSKLSFANLRKPSLKLESSSESDSSSPLGRSFLSPNEEQDSDFADPTIACAPYEEHICGPEPHTDSTEDIGSVRLRRGFRPLSCITSAVNYSINPFPTMDVMVEPQIISEDMNTGTNHHGPLRNASTDTAVSKSKHCSRYQGGGNAHECGIAFSSSEDMLGTVHGDASTLFNTPPPLLSEHPIHCAGENAFKMKTDYPLMTTNTTAAVIKALAKDMNQLSSKSAGFVSDLHKKKSYRNLGGILPRSAPPTRLGYGSELSPTVSVKSVNHTRSSAESAPTPSLMTRAPTYNSDDLRRKPLRKISTIFTRNSKDSSSPTDSIQMEQASQSPRRRKKEIQQQKPIEPDRSGQSSMESTKRKRKQTLAGIPTKTTEEEHFYLEYFIRNHLAYHRKDYKAGKWPHFPPHPNNPNRAWDHANLRCESCIDGFCGCCGRTCCAYQAVTVRLTLFSKESEDNNGLKDMLARLIPDPNARPNPRELTKELKDALDSLRPAIGGKILGGETQTFLQCTECKKRICPSCCGVCPVDACSDTLCRKCKNGDPWSPCNWHEKYREFGRSFGLKESTERSGSTSSMSPMALALRKEWLGSFQKKYITEEENGGPRAFWRGKASG